MKLKRSVGLDKMLKITLFFQKRIIEKLILEEKCRISKK